MKLYVVRHGETLSNVAGIVSGRSDESLTAKGISQAQKVNLWLGDTKFNAVYVSPMKRAIETAEIIVPEYNYEIDERLAERDLGTLKGYTIDELWQNPLWNSLTEMRTKEGAETFGAGMVRVYDYLADVRKKYGDVAQLLLITHSFISRCLWAIENNVTEEKEFAKFSHKNDEVKIYKI